MIEGLKGIADYVTKRSKHTFTVDALRTAMRRRDDPFPIKPFNGYYGLEESSVEMGQVNAWIDRQHGRTRRRSRATRAA